DFHDAALDRIFVEALKSKLKPEIEIKEIDADLDTAEFAESILEEFLDIMEK
ncbi:MAG: Tm-1-like ATP-binding domain-containing protein, partial [Syntrophaceae bacterium]|nr:Tm-1-like ATP-binding domain-containing protein [Syntrophaceae bacterium]